MNQKDREALPALALRREVSKRPATERRKSLGRGYRRNRNQEKPCGGWAGGGNRAS
jgi:hypothetical protein